MQQLMQPPVAARPLQGLSERELVSLYVEPVYRFAALLCSNPFDRDDLAQDALVRAVRHRHRYERSKGEWEAWLWRVTLNVARDRGRAAGRARTLWDRLARQPQMDAAASAESIALERLGTRELVSAIHELPPRYRTVLALRFGAELSYRELAQVLEISEGAVAQSLRRALSALRTKFEEINR